MIYWIIYDISENNLRSRIASKCKDYGLERVQKSAFLGNVTKNKLDMLSIEIKEILQGTENCVFIFPTCKVCFGGRIIEGHFDEEIIKKRDFLILNGAA